MTSYLKKLPMMPKTYEETCDNGDSLFDSDDVTDILERVSNDAKDIFYKVSDDDEDKFGQGSILIHINYLFKHGHTQFSSTSYLLFYKQSVT